MSAAGAGGWRVDRYAALDSTQLEARRRLEAGEGLDRVALVADVQTGGVGRFGRAFASPAGGAWQTLALADPEGRLRDGRVAPAYAAFLADALTRRERAPLLKWPNDLWYAAPGERAGKAGGILIEHVRRHLLIGVGLNARNRPPPGAARLGLPVEAALGAAREAAERLLAEGPPHDVGAAWRGRHLLDGRLVTVGAVRGRVEGLGADGGLRLVDAAGRRRIVRAGTVEAIDPPLGPAVDGPAESRSHPPDAAP